MKKSKLFLAGVLAAVFATSAGALVACGDTEGGDNGGSGEDSKSAYEVTFNANGGKFEGDKTTVKLTTDKDGKIAEAPTDPTYDDNTFLGYTLVQNSGDPITLGTNGHKFTKNTTVYAKWEVNEPDEHDHVWATAWTTSDTDHWHKCTVEGCTEISGKAAHSDPLSEDGKCTVCDRQVQEVGIGQGEHTISLDKSALDLSVGNLTYTLVPTLGVSTDTVTWTVTTGDAVTVDTNGTVTAVKPGTATITASISEDVSATCAVTVAKAYYLIGVGASKVGDDWVGIGQLSVSGAYYFTMTADGVYETEIVTLAKNDNFKIGVVGITDNSMWDNAINGEKVKSDDAHIANAGGWDPNVKVKHSGRFTIKLDLTDASKPKIYSVQIEDLSSQDTEEVYYVRGDNNGWSEITEVPDGNVPTYIFQKVGGVLKATVHFNAEAGFKLAVVGAGWNGEVGSGQVDSSIIEDKGGTTKPLQYNTGVDSNIIAPKTGTYVLTLVDGRITACEFTAD